MNVSTRARKPELVPGLEGRDGVGSKRKSSRIQLSKKEAGKLGVDLEESTVEEFIGRTDQAGNQSAVDNQGEEAIPNLEYTVEEGPEVGEMAQPPPRIDPLVMPRGLPIVVPRDLTPASILTNLPRFYRSRDEDPSLHMERYIETLTSSLVTNEGYYLVWFSTTLQEEAYDWYRGHPEGHFVEWQQLQREFLNHFCPEVGQSAALRAISAVRQGRDEDITSYVRRFELVCTRFVGDMLNNDTLKQFFI